MKKIFLLLIFLPALCRAQIPADSAKYYYGQNVEICGNVLDANTAIRTSPADTTYLVEFELGTRIDNKRNVVCQVSVRCKAGEYETAELRKKYTNTTISVKGFVLKGRAIPRIVVNSMSDVRIK